MLVGRDGIFVGMALCRKLERESRTSGQVEASHSPIHPSRLVQDSLILAIFMLILFFQITELNTFLLKHVFDIPTTHYFIVVRLLLMTLIGAPSLRQYYVYVTDQTCTRLGTQAWVYFGVVVTELLVSIRYGVTVVPQPAWMFMLGWLCLTALFSIFMVLLNTRTWIQKRVE